MMPGGQGSRTIRGVAVASLLLAALTGCGYPAVQPGNLRLTSSLRTALSARNEGWLKINEDQINDLHQRGEMRDDEHEAFRAIIEQARQGDWQGAERAALGLQRAQRPTAEQIEAVTLPSKS